MTSSLSHFCFPYSTAFEDYIKQSNKPVEKNKPVARIGGRGKGFVSRTAEVTVILNF
jgi:hypothetical protein